MSLLHRALAEVGDEGGSLGTPQGSPWEGVSLRSRALVFTLCKQNWDGMAFTQGKRSRMERSVLIQFLTSVL